jgi:hypothetical protein
MIEYFKIVFQKTTLSVEIFVNGQILVYPNPVTNNQFNFKCNYPQVKLDCKVNSIGQRFYETTMRLKIQ